MTLIKADRIYTGRVLNLDSDTVRFPDGSVGQLEMIRHPGASAVLPFLDDPAEPNPRVVLIRQFRHAASDFIYEIPAGRIDPGESAETCAVRELAEETGFRAARLRHLTTIYTTPGFIDERIHLFMASGLEAGTHQREADELLEIQQFRWSEVLELVRAGNLVDSKSLTTILFVQCFVKN
jgi:ADP-ribose pyrophosphatase